MALQRSNGLCIGAVGEHVVFDETVIGLHTGDKILMKPKSVNVGADRRPSTAPVTIGGKKLVKARLPARTIWNRIVKPTKPKMFVKKTKFNKNKAGSDRDRRSNGAWLWVAVSVGKGKHRYTHDNRKKKFTFRMLPKKTEAIRGKPRGVAEIKKCLDSRIHRKSFLIFDKSSYGEKAAKQMGYRHAPAVNHGTGWRDFKTGFHSNDAESENARFKRFSRRRYSGKLNLSASFLYEYAFYVNMGDSISIIMQGLAASNGGRQTVRKVM